MIAIREEIAKVQAVNSTPKTTHSKNAPHATEVLVANEWNHAYSREVAAYPVPSLRKQKYWKRQ